MNNRNNSNSLNNQEQFSAAFLAAIKRNDEAAAITLLREAPKGFDINHLDDSNGNRQTFLMMAAERGLLELVKAMVANKANINKKYRSNYPSTLHYAAEAGQLAVVEYLLSLPKVQINQRTGAGITPLHSAIKSGNLEVVTLLVAKGANLHPPKYERTPTLLELADRMQNQPILKFLEEKMKEAGTSEENTNQEGGQKRKTPEPETPLDEESIAAEEPPRKKPRPNTKKKETKKTESTTTSRANTDNTNNESSSTTITSDGNNNRKQYAPQSSIPPFVIPPVSYHNTPFTMPVTPPLNTIHSPFHQGIAYSSGTPFYNGFYNNSSSLGSMHPFKPASTLLLSTPLTTPMPTPMHPAPTSTTSTNALVNSTHPSSMLSSTSLTSVNTSSTPFAPPSHINLFDGENLPLFTDQPLFGEEPLFSIPAFTEETYQSPATNKEKSVENKPLPIYTSAGGYNPSLFATPENNMTTLSNPAPALNGKIDKNPADKSITEFNHDEMMQVIKILRGKNNCGHNCIALALDVIKYFMTGKTPNKESSTKKPSRDDFNVLLDRDILFTESTNERYAEITKSTIYVRSNDFPPLTPGAPLTPCTPQTPGTPHTPDSHLIGAQEDKKPKDKSKLYRQRSALYDELSDELKKQAEKEANHVSFGIVNLGRSLKVNDQLSEEELLDALLNISGHMLCYFATPENVWYIDCQLYNGRARKNNVECGPIYTNLQDAHTFSNTAKNKEADTFGDTVFYIPIHPHLALTAEPATTLLPRV